MAEPIAASFYDDRGNPVAATANEGGSNGAAGDADAAGGNSAADDNGAQWTSFGGNGADGRGYSDPDTLTDSGSGSDPSAPFGRFANGKPRKRRAKGTGKSGAGTGKRNPAQESIPLASLLYSSHFLLSKIVVPELELTEDESKTLGRAMADVAQYYDVPMVSPQQVAWYNLATTAAMIYGSRFVAYRTRARKEAAEKRPQNVRQMQPLNVGVV